MLIIGNRLYSAIAKGAVRRSGRRPPPLPFSAMAAAGNLPTSGKQYGQQPRAFGNSASAGR